MIRLILIINSTKSTLIQSNCLINLKRTKKKVPLRNNRKRFFSVKLTRIPLRLISLLKSSDGYSKLWARGKDFQNLMFSRIKKGFDLVFLFFSKIIVISKKKDFTSI